MTGPTRTAPPRSPSARRARPLAASTLAVSGRTRRALVRSGLWLGVLGALLAVGGCQPAAQSPSADDARVELQRFEFGGNFQLTGHEGRPVSLSDFQGKAALLFFGYTQCPDVCPVTMGKVASAVERLGDQAGDVQTIFITVDVDRDTPDILADYVSSFSLPLVGLTGSREEVDAVVSAYKASYAITPTESAAGHDVSHTAYTYLIDREGAIRYIYRYADSPDMLADGLRQVLAEES